MLLLAAWSMTWNRNRWWKRQSHRDPRSLNRLLPRVAAVIISRMTNNKPSQLSNLHNPRTISNRSNNKSVYSNISFFNNNKSNSSKKKRPLPSKKSSWSARPTVKKMRIIKTKMGRMKKTRLARYSREVRRKMSLRRMMMRRW